jgi:hypothetical protein
MTEEQKKKYPTLVPIKKGENIGFNPDGTRRYKQPTFGKLYRRVLQCSLDISDSIDEDLKILAFELGYGVGDKVSVKEIMVIKDVCRALRGDRFAIERIQNRTEGMPTQVIDNLKKTLEIVYTPIEKEDLTKLDNFETNSEVKTAVN